MVVEEAGCTGRSVRTSPSKVISSSSPGCRARRSRNALGTTIRFILSRVEVMAQQLPFAVSIVKKMLMILTLSKSMCPDCLPLGLQMRQTSSRDNMLRRAPSSIHGHHRRHSASRPYSLLSRPGRRSRNGFPTTNLTSLGSTNPGIPPILTRTVSTNVRHGKHQKSSWTTVVSWFSNTPERGAPASRLLPHPKKNAAKKILLQRSGELR